MLTRMTGSSRSGLVPLIVAAVILAAAPVLAAVGPVAAGDSMGQATRLDVTLLAAYVLLALIVSFLCSIAEAVLLSVTPAYIESLQERAPKRAARLRRVKQDNVDRSLAAILTLNTIAHTVGAIGAGAKATVVFGSAWFGLFSAVMTLLILLLSEIVPKTIGAVYWTRLTGPVALFVSSLVLGLWPVVWLSEKLTRLLSRGGTEHVFSRDELLAMARVGEAHGHLRGNESVIIRNLLRFDLLTIEDVMTPRTVVFALPHAMTIAAAVGDIVREPYSRVPVFASDLDSISGVVLKDDILIAATRNETDQTLADLSRTLVSVPESMPLSNMLELFLRQRQHMAVVVDEYGGTAGIVTLEDLLESLIGLEIMDETDDVGDLRAHARKQWATRQGRTTRIVPGR